MDSVDRLRQQLEGFTNDFHRVVSALTSLHARNEEDIEELKANLKNLEKALHDLDKQVVVLSTRYEMTQPQRQDLTPLGVPLHQHQQPPAPKTPSVPPKDSPDLGVWLVQTKAVASKWGPLILSALMFLLATLQNCGIIGVRETSNATVITVPGHLPHNGQHATATAPR